MHLPNIHIIIPVWGTKYINLFANFVIPTLIEDNDISLFKICNKFVFEIYTLPEDEATLKANSNFRKLQNKLKGWADLNLIPINESISNPYHTMSSCHRKSISRATANNAAMIFLQPDALAGGGLYQTIIEQLQSGKRVIMAPGLRGALEDITEVIRMRTKAMQPAMSTRELVGCAVENLHHLSRSLIWGRDTINSFCSHIYWPIDERNLYARCAHMHPLMVYPRDKECGFNHTIDWDYFFRAVPDTREWFVADNSDQICLIELSDRNKFEGEVSYSSASYMSLAKFFWRAAQQPHLELMKKPFLFQSQELSRKQWDDQHKEANLLVNTAINETQRGFVSKIICDPSYLISTVARIMNHINYQLESFRRDRPRVGTGIFYTYRMFFLFIRGMYRIVRRIQEQLSHQSNAGQSG